MEGAKSPSNFDKLSFYEGQAWLKRHWRLPGGGERECQTDAGDHWQVSVAGWSPPALTKVGGTCPGFQLCSLCLAKSWQACPGCLQEFISAGDQAQKYLLYPSRFQGLLSFPGCGQARR